MARDAALLAAVTRTFCSEVDRLLKRLGEERRERRGDSSQLASDRLFCGATSLNPHQHVWGLDAVYSASDDGRRIVLASTMTDDDVFRTCL